VNDWTAVEAEINRIIAESVSPFASETIANVGDFLKFVRGRCPVPKISKGYWSTISFTWHTTPSGPLEIEIFGDRIEIYRFYDRRTDIRHVAHVPGEPLAPELIAELPALPGAFPTA
jgi:hypothetical protein